MNSQFAENVHDFTKQLFQAMLQEFDGKEVGSDEMNLDVLMKHHFPGYTPGGKVKKEKKKKKPRALTGYTYFGQQNKENFNKEMNELDEKPKFVSFVGKKWKALTDDEREEWDTKAKESFEASQEQVNS